VNKALLAWLTESYLYFRDPEGVPKPRGIGHGIALAFAVFIMQEAASVMTHHYFLRELPPVSPAYQLLC
jgi:ATP-binding cassette, subfamily C (CFTR/MRP), member 1